ncbi:MAG: M23 family metallopeptidase [Candidatus Moraniibacteriota bacterium]|nr:MAG: M23 family metallopeptidase [Candidatus Moranbacteria bacterium]
MTEMTPREEFGEFLRQLGAYLAVHGKRVFGRFEAVKDVVTGALYHKRGMYAQPILHSLMMALIFFGITFGPSLVQSSIATEEGQGRDDSGGAVLGSLDSAAVVTLVSDKPPSEVRDYTIKDGDTLSGVADKFDVSIDTIKWANESVDFKKLKPGTVIKIPPVTGLVYKVKPGDTIYSIAKKFESSEQAIVDFPFNTFSDDETFALVAGQTLIVPDGVMPDAPSVTTPRFANILTPDAGAVTATGNFVWPAFGRITQGYRWYHPAVDIANRDGGAILAADAGTVVVAGWSSAGYGNHIIIDHGNGYKTLYAHLSSLAVIVGQRVARGATLGQMGSTGRSTGTHLHFEIHGPSGKVDPLGYLK